MMFFSKKNNKNDEIISKEKEQDKQEINDYIKKLKSLTVELNEKEGVISSIQEDYKKMFNLFPDMMVLIDESGTVFDINKTAAETLGGVLDGPIIGLKWKNVLKRCNIKWESTIEKEFIDDKYTKMKSKEVFMTSIGRHLLLNMVPVIREKATYFILIGKDITEVKNREIELIRKQELLISIDDITNVFSHNVNINFILDKTVEILGRLKKIDSCYIYKNCKDSNGNIYAEKVKVWQSPYGKRHSNIIDSFYYNLSLPRWLEFFDLNHIVCGQTTDFPENERQFLASENAKSICIVPIYTPLNLWGFVGFNSCKENKIWQYDEEKLLKIAANIIGAGIYQWSLRNNKEELINKTCISF